MTDTDSEPNVILSPSVGYSSSVPLVTKLNNVTFEKDNVRIKANEMDISDTRCGFRYCSPAGLQKFGNSKVFLVFFGLAGVLQGACFSYFIGILSTLEKRYAFDSSITGIILIADNVSHVLLSVVVGYYGKLSHRPRLLSFGMFVTVLSCFLSCVPYLVYGEKTKFTEPYLKDFKLPQLCDTGNDRNSTNNVTDVNCNHMKFFETNIAVSILFVANFMNGFGSLVYYSIGMSYIDDNVKKTKSPLYLGTTFALRVFGPTFGFWLSSVCLRLYENPFINPGFSNNNPKWIGAWWIGFLLIGGLLILVSFPLAMFPKVMKKPEIKDDSGTRKSLWKSLKQLAKNPILVFHTLSITFQINGLFGYFTFMPKYIENQYQQTASKANFFSGTAAMITTVISILLGSFAIQKFKPKPKSLICYMIFVELFSAIGFISAIFLGCPSLGSQDKFLNPSNYCNTDCKCNEAQFYPICNEQNEMFFSPCHAGCIAYTGIESNVTYHNCTCASFSREEVFSLKSVQRSFCASFDCSAFMSYFILLTFSKALAFTAKVGNMLITLRCVPEQEKALVLGAVESVISVLATIPYPLIYGYVIDKTCIVWEKNCGKNGNCLQYDNDKFRNHLHILSVSFIGFGCLCELVVLSLNKNIKDFYGKEEEDNIKTNVDSTRL